MIIVITVNFTNDNLRINLVLNGHKFNSISEKIIHEYSLQEFRSYIHSCFGSNIIDVKYERLEKIDENNYTVYFI